MVSIFSVSPSVSSSMAAMWALKQTSKECKMRSRFKEGPAHGNGTGAKNEKEENGKPKSKVLANCRSSKTVPLQFYAGELRIVLSARPCNSPAGSSSCVCGRINWPFSVPAIAFRKCSCLTCYEENAAFPCLFSRIVSHCICATVCLAKASYDVAERVEKVSRSSYRTFPAPAS